MSSSTKRLLTLKTSDSETFLVNEEAAAAKFGFIKDLVEGGCTGGVIAVPLADSKTMATILKWCKKHTDKNATIEELKDWDAEFVKDFDQAFLYHLMIASDYLNGIELVNLLAQKVADMIKGKKVEEIREIFKIKNDIPPELEEQIRRKNAWAFY